MNLIKIEAKEYGLEESKAKQITDMFMPMLQKMEDLEEKFNSIVNLDITPDTILKAKELRLEYVKVRTGTAKIHKELKRFYLQGGKFVDGWKNAQLMASEGNEKRLLEIEKHFENIEKEKKQKILDERINILLQYDCGNIPGSLIDMEEEVFQNYLFGVKKNFEMKKEAERKAEEDRLAREKEEAEERERIEKENERLKKEAEERQRIESERIKKEKEEQEAKEKKEKLERMAREKLEDGRREKERKELEKKELALKKEREEKEKIQAELKKKEQEEERAKAEEQKRIQDELNKSDIDKVRDLIKDLTQIKSKYKFESAFNKKMFEQVCVLLDKIIEYFKTKYN